MKKILIATIAVAWLGTMGLASAQTFNWTGFYAGATAGYGWSDSQHRVVGSNRTNPFDVNGFVGGGTLGYNVQVERWVYGIEGDLSYAHQRGSVSGTNNFFSCGTGCFTRVTGLATARVRLGYAIDRWLPYVTGGFATLRQQAYNNDLPGTTSWRADWTIGGGIEYAFAPNWSAKIEYLHIGAVDSKTYLVFGAPIKTSSDDDIVRAGLNYRFVTY